MAPDSAQAARLLGATDSVNADPVTEWLALNGPKARAPPRATSRSTFTQRLMLAFRRAAPCLAHHPKKKEPHPKVGLPCPASRCRGSGTGDHKPFSLTVTTTVSASAVPSAAWAMAHTL